MMEIAQLPRFPVTLDGQTVRIGTTGELVVALDVLQGQYDRATLDQLRGHLPQIIRDGRELLTVMKSLSADDQLFLLEALGEHLAGILKDAERLRDLLAMLADERVEQAVLETLGGDGLNSLIHNARELSGILEWIYGSSDSRVLEAIGMEKLRGICRSAGDIGLVLHSLDRSLQGKLLEGLGWDLVAAGVRDGHDLSTLLRALPPDASKRLLQHFTAPRLRQLIGNPDDWAYLYQRLEPEEAEFITKYLDIQ
jgi:hypothetical protein